MCPGVADGRKLGIPVFIVPFVPPAPPGVVGRDVACLHAGRIDGGQFAGFLDQAASASESNCCIKQALGAPFFRRRPSA